MENDIKSDNNRMDEDLNNILTMPIEACWDKDNVDQEKLADKKKEETLMRTVDIFLNTSKSETDPVSAETDVESGHEELHTKGLNELMFEKLVSIENRSNYVKKEFLENIKNEFVSLGAKKEESGRTLLFHVLR